MAQAGAAAAGADADPASSPDTAVEKPAAAPAAAPAATAAADGPPSAGGTGTDTGAAATGETAAAPPAGADEPTRAHSTFDAASGAPTAAAAAAGAAAAGAAAGTAVPADAPTRAFQGMPAPPAEGDPDAPTPPQGFPRVPQGAQTAQFPPAWAAQQGHPGQPGQGYPGQWPPQAPPQEQKRSGGTGKKIVAIVAALLLVAVAAGVGWFFYDRAQRTVALVAADQAGSDPFTPSFVQGGPLAPTTRFDTAANRNPVGSLDGLYFDANGTGACNRDQLASALQADPELAAGWATPLGSSAQSVGTYVGTLTPMRLRADTRVTSHGWSGGQAEPYAAVLQAGSAVLVDDRGVPRVHCADGAPLVAAQPVADPHYGTAWDGFDPAALLEVRPAVAAIPEFGLVDTAGEQPFRRPVGSTGSMDVAALPDTGRFAGAYTLTGAQTRCEGLVNCAGVSLLTLSPQFSGCPQSCVVTEREVGDNVALTKDGATWRASGDVPQNRAFTCQSRPTANTFTVSFTPTRSEVVDGVWTATSVRADYERRAPAEAGCVPVQVAWTISGVGG